jgi:hypothetical protein
VGNDDLLLGGRADHLSELSGGQKAMSYNEADRKEKMNCETHKVKLGDPRVADNDVIRSGECANCGQTIDVVYGFAGAYIGKEEVFYEEVKN